MVEEQQLRHHQVRDLVVNGRAEEDNALFEKQRINVVGALTAARRLNYHGDDVFDIRDHVISFILRQSYLFRIGITLKIYQGFYSDSDEESASLLPRPASVSSTFS